MHIVATSPKYLTRDKIPNEVIQGEKDIIKEQLVNTNSTSNKKIDEKNIDKIVNSKMNKWYEENVLSEQTFVIIDHEEENKPTKIVDLVKERGNAINNELSLKEFRILI